MIFINSYTSFPVVVVQTSVEYPPQAMTANSTLITGQAYGNGTYVASASSEYPDFKPAWTSFNKLVSGVNSEWMGVGAIGYSTTTGLYPVGTGFSTNINGTNRFGEWLQLEVPVAITLTSYTIQAPAFTSGDYYRRCPFSWFLGGSNDGTTWALVDTRTSQGVTAFFQVIGPFGITSSPPAYKMYRLVITSANPLSPDSNSQVGELRFFGY
jgi:hypothetical protein